MSSKSNQTKCASNLKADPTYKNRSATDWDRSGYGMSYVMVGSPSKGWTEWGETPGPEFVYRTATLRDMAKTIVVADQSSWNWGVHFENYASGQYFNPANGSTRSFRHAKGANYLFGDGHVEFLTKETIVPYLSR